MAHDTSDFKSNTSSNSLMGQKGGQATTMAELMAKNKSSFVTLKKGESLKAKITKLTQNEMMVDAGAKTEAIVLEKDKRILRTILGMFKVGDTVEVSVLNPESDSGQPIVSMRRFLGNLAWTKLEELQKSKEQIEVAIVDATKAGYLVNTDFGIAGFLPQSHASYGQQSELTAGMRVNASVLELNRKDNKIIFSQKTAISEDDFAQAMKQMKVGQTVDVTIANVTPFGLFVTLPYKKAKGDESLEGFIHVSEIAWEKVEDLTSEYSSGEKIQAVVTRFDTETRRINLSVKRLTKDPFEAMIEKYPVDKKISGIVTKVEDSGVTIELEEGLEGIIKKDKIPPTTKYTVGQNVTATVTEHDKKRHKISLTPVLLEKPIGYR
jgi:small subunit ribosomal protein S1